MMNWIKKWLLWKESPERKKVIRKKGKKILLCTTILGILTDAILYLKFGWFPELLLILLFFIGAGSWWVITGQELPPSDG